MSRFETELNIYIHMPKIYLLSKFH